MKAGGTAAGGGYAALSALWIIASKSGSGVSGGSPKLTDAALSIGPWWSKSVSTGVSGAQDAHTSIEVAAIRLPQRRQMRLGFMGRRV